MGKAGSKKTFMESIDKSTSSPGPGHYESEYKNIGMDS